METQNLMLGGTIPIFFQGVQVNIIARHKPIMSSIVLVIDG